ncbi:MAG: fatty acid desaturase [Candidatus Eremiobacterota bacterium]
MIEPRSDERLDWVGAIPFALLHLSVLLVFWTGASLVAVAGCLASYLIRMFGITAGYHRYFSHRSYQTGRAFQLTLALLGASSAQMGPLWWAAHHRHHHAYSDTDEDVHSPGLRGFFWAHIGWFLCRRHAHTNYHRVRDLTRFPELVLLDRLPLLAPVAYAVFWFLLGVALEPVPALGTDRWQMFVWGFLVSTVLLYHGTFCINSLCHVIGTRRFETRDDSRNNLWLALITLGEGWHNNHHRFPSSERQGFYPHEIDLTHAGLALLSRWGVVWGLREPPESVLREGQEGRTLTRTPLTTT